MTDTGDASARWQKLVERIDEICRSHTFPVDREAVRDALRELVRLAQADAVACERERLRAKTCGETVVIPHAGTVAD